MMHTMRIGAHDYKMDTKEACDIKEYVTMTFSGKDLPDLLNKLTAWAESTDLPMHKIRIEIEACDRGYPQSWVKAGD